MIIRQTTAIVFEYPQDYLQEQEWCKTKEDRWIHKSTDTMCTVYENTISYSIGQPSSSEKPNNCEDEPQKHCHRPNNVACHPEQGDMWCRGCGYWYANEPQTERGSE